MEADSKDSRNLNFTAKAAVELKPFPGEFAQRHEKTAWWDHMMVRISSVPGLTEVAHHKEPSVIKSIVIIPLDELGELPADHKNYESRKETRIRIKAQNDANMINRYNIWMGLRTGLFASLYNSMEESNSIFAESLYESCDYRRLGLTTGHFDGELAFSMAHTKLFGDKRSQTDIDFYDTAKDIQKKSQLPDGCKNSDFVKKAHAWIHRIRPNLQQSFTDEDAADHIINMLPKRL